jgi:capsular polysaccharide transport system ATP-binding protein
VLIVRNLTKRYPFGGGHRTVLRDVNLRLERGQKVGILGRNGSGKSTLIRVLGGSENPDAGEIHRGMSVSWPLALGGGFQVSLSGMDNLRFICRVYGVSIEDKVPFVREFTELGRYLHEPMKSYSAGMRARLAFALSMVIEFDCYLIDEVMAVGDDRFKERCQYELFEKRGDRSMLIVAHNIAYIRQHCDTAAVLLRGQLHHFDTIDEGYAFYQAHASEQ